MAERQGNPSPPDTEAQPVSVVVVSQGRPQALRRCLMALEQQFHPNFEVIVVADDGGCQVAKAFNARILPFEQTNISAARNAGIGLAAAAIIAFIDDDAAAEPGWLLALTRPFDSPDIAGVGGFVLGRNGISWQWRGRQLDALGQSFPLATPASEWSSPTPAPGRALRVEGTNMAFRAEILRRHGGFDEAFAFYHDESDLCWRLHQSQCRLALAPGAVVHHGFLPSVRRRQDRMPRDLSDIGRACALYLMRHAPDLLEPELARIRLHQRQRLLSHMVAGRCMPGDVARLLQGFDRGAAEAEQLGATPRLPVLPAADPAGFQRFQPQPPQQSRVFAGPKTAAESLHQAASAARRQGDVATLILLGRSALYHHICFGDDGIWRQTGGQFGRSDRKAPLFKNYRLNARIDAEITRAKGTGRFPQHSGR